MDADGEAVTMSPQQLQAVTTFGSEHGGTIEVHAAENGALLVFAEDGQVIVFQRDGSAARVR
jgi:hypothetical protein